MKIHTIYLAATPKPKQIRGLEKIDVIPKKNYILFVGTLEPRKNIDRLIQAFSLLNNNLRNNFQLIICGGKGWGNINVEEIIKKYGLDNNQVVSTGYVANFQLKLLYQNAYCLALPSLYEGFGLPILEAHSFGVPVITSNISSMPEVAGNAAIYIDPLNVNNIKEGLQKLLSNKSLRNNLSKNAILNNKNFSWKKTTQHTITAFKAASKLFQEKSKLHKP